jgi:TatD DNase family protein
VFLIDTHAHLDFPELAGDLGACLERAAHVGVKRIVTIGIGVSESLRAVEIAAARPEVFATVGIHPHGARPLDAALRNDLKTLARRPKVVAVGEIGLDYYRDRQPRPIQRRCFEEQLELAGELGLPVVVHVRDAYEDALNIIAVHADRLPGVVLHCFSGDWAAAERCLAWGCYLSMPGTVTFAKARMQQEVARRMPVERLLLETDAPFLAPEPHRGKVNEPAYLLHTARKVASLRQVPLAELAQATTRNAMTVFRLGEAEAEPDCHDRQGLGAPSPGEAKGR